MGAPPILKATAADPEAVLRDTAFKDQVAMACRIVALEGYADLTLGHVSVRDGASDRVFIKRKGPGLHEIEPHDVLVHRLSDDAALKTTPHMHFEAVLHTEVYKRRKDVNAVIHSHAPYGIALGASDTDLEMISHDSVLFADGIAVFDDYSLITELDEGRAVAETLGDKRVVLLRNHGVLVVGEDIKWCVLAAVTLERTIKIQLLAKQMSRGNLKTIRPEDARTFMKIKYQDRFMDEYWEGWRRSVRNASPIVPRQVGFD